MKKITLSGGFLVFLGAAFWSLNSPLVKYLSLDPVLICALRSVIAGIALAATIRPKQLSWNGWTLVYVVSYTGLCMSIILALGATSAPVAIGMQYTATIWLFLVGLLRTHRFRFKSFLPVLVIFIGVVFFMCSGSDAASQKGNLIALTEGVFFALMTISSKKVAGKNPVGLSAVGNLFAGAAIFLFVPGTVGKMSVMTGLDWVIMLVLGSLSALGYGPLAGVTVFGMQFLDFFDFLTNSVMMPIAAITTCLLVSRVIGVEKIEEEVTLEGKPFRRKRIFNFMIKYLCPIFAAIILISSVANALGVISM